MTKIIRYSLFPLYIILFMGVMFGLSQTSISTAEAKQECGMVGLCNLGVKDDWNAGGSSGNGIGGGKPPGAKPPGGGTPVKPSPPVMACDTGAHYTVKMDEKLPGIPGGWNTLSSANNCVQKYKTKTKFLPAGSSGYYCSDNTNYGIVTKSVGTVQLDVAIVKIAKKYDPEGAVPPKAFYGYAPHKTTYTCVYPKVTSIATNKYCAISTNGTLDRLSNSRLGAKRMKSFAENITSVSSLKNGSGVCKQSANISFNAGIPNNENNWGQYKLSGKIKFVRCTEYKVSFEGSSKRHFSCGSVQNTPSVTAYATLWCGGADTGLVPGKTWTMNDCYGPMPGGYGCTVPDPMYDGKKGTVQTLRDGKSRVLNWGAPKPNISVRNAKNWEQAVTINKGSSPRLTSVGDNDKSKQMFWSNVSFGTKWVASKNQQNVAFYNASNPGQSWSATKKLRFDGQFKTIVGEPTSYNPWTGKMNLKEKVVWVNDYNIKCETAVSPKVQALRSIGDAQ